MVRPDSSRKCASASPFRGLGLRREGARMRIATLLETVMKPAELQIRLSCDVRERSECQRPEDRGQRSEQRTLRVCRYASHRLGLGKRLCRVATIRHEIPPQAFFRFASKSLHRNDRVFYWWRGKNGKTATTFSFFNGVAVFPFFLPLYYHDLSFRTPCQSECSGDLQGVRNLLAGLQKPFIY